MLCATRKVKVQQSQIPTACCVEILQMIYIYMQLLHKETRLVVFQALLTSTNQMGISDPI